MAKKIRQLWMTAVVGIVFGVSGIIIAAAELQHQPNIIYRSLPPKQKKTVKTVEPIKNQQKVS